MPKDQFTRIIDVKRSAVAVRGAGGSSGGGGTGGGVTDHGMLTGLSGDDHLQYLTNARGDVRYPLKTLVLTAGDGMQGGGDLSGPRTFAVDSTVVRTSRELTAGPGILGGGDLSQNRSFALDTHDIFALHTVTGGENFDIVGQSGPGVLARLTPTHDVAVGDGIERILKSNDSGFVQLKSLTVAGSVDITNGGDFTVGNKVLFVDVSYGSVGINKDADQQFALDVNGPLRATYLIGKHAIQLSHAMLLVHYDGHPKSYNGSLDGLNGIVGRTSGAHFLPGKFNTKGIARSGATTNWCRNPSFESGVHGGVPSNWNTFASTGTGASWTMNDAISHTGAQCLQIVNGSGTNTLLHNNVHEIAIPNGDTTYASVWVYREEYIPGSIILSDNTSSLAETHFDVTATAVLHDWVEYKVEWTNNTGASKNIHIRINSTGAQGDTFWIDSVMWAVGTVPGQMYPYFDGNCDLFDTHTAAWTGTVNASASTITPGAVNYTAAGAIDPISGSVMFWVKPYTTISARWLQMVSTDNANHYMQLGTLSTGSIFARHSTTQTAPYYTTGPVAVPGQWYHIVMTYTRTLVSLYVNGDFVSSYIPAEPYDPGATDVLQIWNTGAGIIDDVATTKDVLHPKLIKAIYESDAPIFAESSVMSLRATLNGLFYANEEGLWGRNWLGEHMFGMYGAAGTKTWGGKTLATGDLLIGRNTQYLRWDDDAGILEVSGAITVTNSIPSSQVTGLGDLATQDNVSTGQVTGLGTLATQSSVSWTTQVTARPVELTDGRITDALNSAGTVISKVVPAAAAAASATGLYLGSDRMGFYSAGAWKTYIDDDGQFFLTGAAGGNSLSWNGTTLLINGQIYVGSTNRIWLNYNNDGSLAIGGSVQSSAPFKVTAAGDMTSISGSIGGVRVENGYIETGSGSSSVGIVGTLSGGHITIIWGGSAYSGRNTAPFRVTSLGHVHARNLIASISGSPLDVWSYSDGVATGSQLASFYRATATESAIAIGSGANKFEMLRADSLTGNATLINYGAGSVILATNGSRSAQLTANGDFSTYTSSGTIVLGRISSTGILKSRNNPSTNFYMAAYAPETSFGLNPDAYVVMGIWYGMMYIICSTSGQSAILLIRGNNAPIIVGQTNGLEFTTVIGTDNKTNVGYTGTAMIIENTTAAAKSYHVHFHTLSSFT